MYIGMIEVVNANTRNTEATTWDGDRPEAAKDTGMLSLFGWLRLFHEEPKQPQ